MRKQGPLLHGKYLIRVAPLRWALKLSELLQPPSKKPFLKCPKKILVSNIGHMGDVVIGTALLEVLKAHFPDVRIDCLVGSWAAPVLQNHPHVTRLHFFDHWKLNRTVATHRERIANHFSTMKKAVAAIRKEKYDLAIDARFFWPNTISLLKDCKIPARLGFTSAGNGPLLTHSLKWVYRDQPIAYYYADLLESVGLITPRKSLRPNLAPVQAEKGQYIVFHIASGNPQKEWPLEQWRALAEMMKEHTIFWTGKEKRESEMVEKVIRGLPHCHNKVGLLGWHDFLKTLQGAQLLVGVDSLAGHLAAALDTPSVLLYTGINDHAHWGPMSTRATILTEKVPCAPCHWGPGCATMDCIRKVSAAQVLQACEKRLYHS